MMYSESTKMKERLDERVPGTEFSAGFDGSVMGCPSIPPESDARAWGITKTATLWSNVLNSFI